MRTDRGAAILPVCGIACLSGMALVIIAIADTAARAGSSSAGLLFWAGMFGLWAPTSVRLVGRQATRSERIGLLVMLGLGMYVVSILHSPRYLTGYDELNHWREAQDIARSGHLFNPNPGLSIIPLYPGLETATSGLSSLTGLSAVVAGRLVVAVARLVVILALYLTYERVGRSNWLAGIATAVYCTNPQFLFFDSAFSYESLGIGLALLAIYALARVWVPRTRSPRRAAIPDRATDGAWRRATWLVVLPLAATVVTHHITTYALVITLVLLAGLSHLSEAAYSRRWLWAVAGAGLGLALVWFLPIARQMIDYLGPPISGGLHEVASLISGLGRSRPLFQHYAGPATPPIERIGSYAFALISVLAALAGAVRIWKTRRLDAFGTLLALGGLVYPVTGLFHFTSNAFLGSRAFAYIFVPVAYCIAVAARGASRKRKRTWTAALVLGGAVLFYGGAALGNPPWDRLPGPYLAAADDRSVEAQGISAATWMGGFLPHNSRMASDRVNGELAMAFGDQWQVRSAGARDGLAPIFLTSALTAHDRQLIQKAALDYVVLDYRLTRALPTLGFYYYYLGESGPAGYRRPIPAASFQKFDHIAGVSRVFDSGNIVIFDVHGLVHG
jgi:hypothetical protein